MSRRAWFAMALVGGLTVFSLAQAPEGGGEGGGGRRNRQRSGGGGQGGQEGRRGDFDPAQMRERMLSRMKEQMGATDEEWKTLQPKVEKVMSLQTQLRPFSAGFRRGSGSDQPESKVGEAQRDLRTALDDKNTSADDIAKKVAAVREAREKVRTDLKTAQKDLKGTVNARQEAALVLAMLLD